MGMTLRATDLNLLPILRALLSEGSVTGAARALGLSQPATSNALGRLRHVLGDPLLVQVGRTMRLTPRAERLRPMLDGACTAIEALLLDAAFAPDTTQRSFAIATPDYMALLLGPALMRLFRDAAPGISVRFIDVGPDVRNEVASGRVDLGIIAKIEPIVRGLCIESGYGDRLVGVVAAGHPLANDPAPDQATLAKWPRLGINTDGHPGTRHDAVRNVMSDQHAPVTLSASHMMVLPLLAAQTDGVAIVPKALADRAAQMVPLACFDLPGPEVPLDICLIWSPLLDADPAHRWFREAVGEAMGRYFSRTVRSG